MTDEEKRFLGRALSQRPRFTVTDEDKRHLGRALSQRFTITDEDKRAPLGFTVTEEDDEKRSIGPALNMRYKTWRYTDAIGGNKRPSSRSLRTLHPYPRFDKRSIGSALNAK